MATVAEGGLGGKASPQEQGGSGGDRPPGAKPRSFPVWRWVIFLLSAAYFLIPLYAALRFAGLKAFPDIFKQSGFYPAIGLSLRLALVTTILTLVLMVPTTIYVHLRLPRARRSMEGITILPIVIPPMTSKAIPSASRRAMTARAATSRSVPRATARRRST